MGAAAPAVDSPALEPVVAEVVKAQGLIGRTLDTAGPAGDLMSRSRPVPLKSITKSIASERDIAAARSPAKGFVRPWRAHNMEVTPIANQ